MIAATGEHILSDDALAQMITGCRQHDLASQEQLYKYCYPVMIRICLRYAPDMDTAALIYNNAMLRVFKYIDRYNDEGKLMAWISTIVVNCCLDHVKQRQRFQSTATLDTVEESASIAAHALDGLSARDVQALIQSLPKATAVVFNLYVYDGFNHREIGQALGIAEGSSKWHLSEARRLLKQKLIQLLSEK